MSSPLQIEANRRNSLKSTGPRTPQGKSASRFNALKSGIHAQANVIPGEDPAELEDLATGYHEQFQPATPMECFLVDTLIRADWQLRRLHRIEAQLWTHQVADSSATEPLAEAYTRSLDPFTRLSRRIEAAERSYYRALTQLQRAAKAAELSDPLESGLPQAAEELSLPPELASFRNISASELAFSNQPPLAPSPPAP